MVVYILGYVMWCNLCRWSLPLSTLLPSLLCFGFWVLAYITWNSTVSIKCSFFSSPIDISSATAFHFISCLLFLLDKLPILISHPPLLPFCPFCLIQLSSVFFRKCLVSCLTVSRESFLTYITSTPAFNALSSITFYMVSTTTTIIIIIP